MDYSLPVHINKGSRRSPTVVLLHGLGNTYKSWTFVVESLNTKKVHVVALDLLGFGTAPKPAHCKYTPADHAAAVIKTLDSLRISHAVIAGHSMGCIVAVEIAKQRPDLAKKLVLLGAPFYVSKPQQTLFQKINPSAHTYFTIFEFLKKNPDITITSANVADALPTVKGMEITAKTWPAFKASLENTIMQFQSFKDACHLKTPTLLVYGLLDVFVVHKNLRAIARKNRAFVRLKTTLGPHEITPLQGRRIAKMIEKSCTQ